MKVRYFILTLFLAFSFAAQAQGDTRQTDIIKYLTVNGTYEQYEDAYEQMFDVIKQQFAGSEVPSTVWVELKQSKNDEVQKIVVLLSSAYRKHFSKEDITAMLAFYSTDTGKQMMADMGGMSPEQNKELTAYLMSDVGQKLDSIRPELVQDISQISEYWSRDLFMDTRKKLIDKGYAAN